MNKSILIKQPGKVEIIDAIMPEIEENEALLKILYGGICGSDLGTYKGTFAYSSYPRIPGHEFSAEIIKIGNNEKGLKKGMIVTGNPYFNCGDCYSCVRGLVNCCENNQTMGAQKDGVFSKYITLPIDRIYDSQGISPKTLSLVEPFCISYHGVKRAGVQRGDKVLIIGGGTIGILAMIAAKLFGAEVYVSDVEEKKLDYARKLGANGTILNKEINSFQDDVDRITNGQMFDVVIEAVGLPETFESSINSVAYGGKVVLIGISKLNLDFNFSQIQKKELNIYGSRNALKEDFEEVIKIINQSNINLEDMITNIYKFDEAPKAFEDFSKNPGEMLKVILDFN